MNNWIRSLAATLAIAAMGTSAFAQEQKEKTLKDKAEKTQEIVIRKKGDKAEKMTIVVDGDDVTINGKPVDEFKNDDVTVFKRDRSLAMAAPRIRRFGGENGFLNDENFNFMRPSNSNNALLGVLTQKADDGVKVSDVTKESGAEKAGLQKEDVITKVGSKEVKDPQDLIAAIGEHKPNDKVDITYKRGGKENKTSVTLGENKSRGNSFNLNGNFNWPKGSLTPPLENFNFNFNRPRIGLQIQDVEEGKGVRVKGVDNDSPASKAGFKDGDVITQANGKVVAGVDELRNAIRDLKEGDTVKFNYRRAGKNQTADIKIPKRLKSASL